MTCESVKHMDETSNCPTNPVTSHNTNTTIGSTLPTKDDGPHNAGPSRCCDGSHEIHEKAYTMFDEVKSRGSLGGKTAWIPEMDRVKTGASTRHDAEPLEPLCTTVD